MRAHLRPAVVASVLFLLIFGLAYPLAETGVAQALFPYQASGSLTANGSTLVAQTWSGPSWFHGRPDADLAMASGGANLGPRSKALVQAVKQEETRLRQEGITPTNDLVTTSFSGYDPDISPADAYDQVASVARARHLPAAEVHRLVAAHVHGAQFAFLGAPYVDVLELNVALSKLS
jgi:K+-transporting ATPase ATPase C chain